MTLSVVTLALTLALVGCTHEASLPAVPHAPEDLSQWTVPELVQPPVLDTPVPPPLQEKTTVGEQVFDFAPGASYALKVGLSAPVDLLFQRGEQVRNVEGGDRAPAEGTQPAGWTARAGADGNGESLRHHLFLSVATAGHTTGLIVTTTARTYYLTCTSVTKTPVRTVRWRYPADAPGAKPATEPGLLPDPAQPKHYHVGYAVVGNTPAWTPRQVVDDGKHTYILYPEIALFEHVPLVRLIGPHGPQLVNARQYLNVVMLDQLVARAELRVGTGEHAEVVTITRGNLATIACPGDAACPVWPQAATALARRHP